MNILQILPELNIGGVETGVVDLAIYLKRLGHKSIVVSAGGALVEDLRKEGVVHYQLPVNEKSVFTMWRMVKELYKIIKLEEIDIVHARSRVSAWSAFFACRRKPHTVFITTCHGYYSKGVLSRVMGWGKLVIVISQIIGKHMIEDFGVGLNRIRLIHRSVNLERFKFKGPQERNKIEFIVAMIGRLSPIKGHAYFIQAMSKVSRVIPHIKVWIVGDASPGKEDYKQDLEVLVRRFGLAHCTEFLGRRRDIPELLSLINVVVLATTTQEAFGRVIIEAQAAGVPVVATEVGGVTDIIEHGKDGILVPPKDSDAIKEGVLKILREPNFSRRLIENGRKKVEEKFNLDLMARRTLDVYKDALSMQNILIIKLGAPGDVILSSAAFREIRKNFPNAKIFCLVGKDSFALLSRCPYIDELIIYDFKDKDKGWKGILKTAGVLQKEYFDIVVDLQNNRKSHILSYLTLSARRYGYHKKFGFLLNYKVKDTPLPPVEHQFRILNMLGIELKEPYLELWVSPDDEAYIDKFLESERLIKSQALVGINIGASSRWASKAWPIENIEKFIQRLSEHKKDLRIVITGTAQDLKVAQSLSGTAKTKSTLRPAEGLINACAKTTLNQLACLIKRCKVFISADSAPLHIAAAVGTPFVAMFGPTDPKRHLPPAKKFILLNKNLDCSPCYKPKCRTQRCMEEISADEVFQALVSNNLI